MYLTKGNLQKLRFFKCAFFRKAGDKFMKILIKKNSKLKKLKNN